MSPSEVHTGGYRCTAVSLAALRLERVVGVPAHIWIGLESEYRQALARTEESREQNR